MEEKTTDIQPMEDNDPMMRSGQMPTAHEELEVRRAFVRKRAAAPDVDAAWDTWARSHRRKASIRRIAMVAAVAASAALVIIMTGVLRGKGGKGEVFTADASARQVTCTADDGTETVVKGSAVDFQSLVKGGATVRHIRMLTLATSRGKTVRAALPDGTVAYLNADSRIDFPEAFTGKRREVTVSGEVFLDVAKDKSHPFVVTTPYFTSTVLGTSFNVRARGEDDASLTLVSGRVDIRGNDGDHEVLRPGECAVWSKDAGLDISTVDTYPITQWKEGYFYFNNEPLVDIMRELGRWYNVSVVFEKPQDMTIRVHFIAEHADNISDIIRRLNDLKIVDIELKDNVATVR